MVNLTAFPETAIIRKQRRMMVRSGRKACLTLVLSWCWEIFPFVCCSEAGQWYLLQFLWLPFHGHEVITWAWNSPEVIRQDCFSSSFLYDLSFESLSILTVFPLLHTHTHTPLLVFKLKTRTIVHRIWNLIVEQKYILVQKLCPGVTWFYSNVTFTTNRKS